MFYRWWNCYTFLREDIISWALLSEEEPKIPTLFIEFPYNPFGIPGVNNLKPETLKTKNDLPKLSCKYFRYCQNRIDVILICY